MTIPLFQSLVYLEVDNFGDSFLSFFLWIFSLFHLDNVLLTLHDVLVQVVNVGLQVLNLKKQKYEDLIKKILKTDFWGLNTVWGYE